MELCSTCGKPHERDGNPTCIGHRSDGEPCLAYAIQGGTVCYKRHGGKAPQVQAAAAQRLEMARVEKAVVTYGLPREIDAFDAMREVIWRTAGHVHWLAEIVAELEKDSLVWGKTQEEAGKGTGQKEGNTAKIRNEAAENIWLIRYDKERKLLVDVCRAAIQCGLAQREVELLESQGRLISDMLRNVFDDPELGLDDGTKRRLREVAIRHLRDVA